MQSKKDRWREDLVVASPLRDLVPQDHLLGRVDGVLGLPWLHEAVRECYCQDNGRPSIDPEPALRLMLSGFFEGNVHDRELTRLSLRKPPPGVPNIFPAPASNTTPNIAWSIVPVAKHRHAKVMTKRLADGAIVPTSMAAPTACYATDT